MKNTILLSLACFCLLPPAACPAAQQQAVAVIFSSTKIEPYKQAWRGFEKFLQQKEAAVSVSQYDLEAAAPGAIPQQLSQQKPALVFAIGTNAAKFAKENAPDIPLLFCMVLNHQAFSGRNAVGVTMDIPAATKLAKIKKFLPEAKRVGLIYSPASAAQYEEIAEACDELGLKLTSRKIASEKEFPDALKELSWQIDYFLMVPDPKIYFTQSIQFVLLESLRNKFPVIGLSASYTKAGALLSFDYDYQDLGRQAGEIALSLFAGAKPQTLPLAKPETIKTSLNLLTAERLGLEMSPALVREAAEVFGK